ncbi:hypothetical protein MKX03_023064, partial [Papaver bracteatum]
SFMVSLHDENSSDTSSVSSLLFPPGFEPLLNDTSDDASSGNQEATDSTQVVPKRLKSEWKRLGVTEIDISSPSSKRTAKTRGQNYSQ